jgi:signal transduction histidine kinase
MWVAATGTHFLSLGKSRVTTLASLLSPLTERRASSRTAVGRQVNSKDFCEGRMSHLTGLVTWLVRSACRAGAALNRRHDVVQYTNGAVEHPTCEGPHCFECHLVPEVGSNGLEKSILAATQDVSSWIRAPAQCREQLWNSAHVVDFGMLGTLVSELAHEINQPLHAIANFTQASITVLERTPANQRPNLCDWLQQISQQVDRATEVIRCATLRAQNADAAVGGEHQRNGARLSGFGKSRFAHASNGDSQRNERKEEIYAVRSSQ